MNFVNKLVSRILVLVSLFLAYCQIAVAYKYDAKDVMVFVNSIVLLVLIIANLVYNIVLTVKYGKIEKEAGNKNCKYNLIVSGVAAVLSIVSFTVSMTSYLYLIWY